MRGNRKLEHLNHSLLLHKESDLNKDHLSIRFVPQELPNRDLTNVNIETVIAGIKLNKFLIFNASTGGTELTNKYLFELAEIANSYKIALAVGSQTAMLRENTISSYQELRRRYPKLKLISNVPAHLNSEEVKTCVDSICADFLQVHLNLAQEAIMPEGDTDFREYLNNIIEYSTKLDIPMIIKGVGYGISRETILKFKNVNYNCIDIAGNCGINFTDVENKRRQKQIHGIEGFGLTTYESLLETIDTVKTNKDIIASGGIYNPIEAVKCLAIGAKAVGIITPILNYLVQKEYKLIDTFLEDYFSDTKVVMKMLGCNKISQLTNVPLIISGNLADYSQVRNIDIKHYANRLG